MAEHCICYLRFDGQLQNRQYDNFHTLILLSECSIAPVCKLTKGPRKNYLKDLKYILFSLGKNTKGLNTK